MPWNVVEFVSMATLTEIFPKIFTVSEPLHVGWKEILKLKIIEIQIECLKSSNRKQSWSRMVYLLHAFKIQITKNCYL